jgi:hypothetical protein
MSAEAEAAAKRAKMMSGLTDSATEATKEIYRMMPDSLLFGSFLLYVLTQHTPFGVFALFVLELILSHKLVGWVMAQSVGATPVQNPSAACRMGYKIGRMDFRRLFSHASYPSFGVFSIMGVIAYLGRSMITFSETLDAMGPVWASRKIVAAAFSIALCVIVIGGRIYSGCESIGEIFIAAALGVGAGLLFYSLHLSLFGEQGVNFLGLPYLVTKESQGTPIYVCHTPPR